MLNGRVSILVGSNLVSNFVHFCTICPFDFPLDMNLFKRGVLISGAKSKCQKGFYRIVTSYLDYFNKIGNMKKQVVKGQKMGKKSLCFTKTALIS